jgi:hypothetical protein
MALSLWFGLLFVSVLVLPPLASQRLSGADGYRLLLPFASTVDLWGTALGGILLVLSMVLHALGWRSPRDILLLMGYALVSVVILVVCQVFLVEPALSLLRRGALTPETLERLEGSYRATRLLHALALLPLMGTLVVAWRLRPVARVPAPQRAKIIPFPR